MNKYLKIGLVAIAIVAVFAISFFIKPKDNVYEIDYNEYKKIIEKNAIVYYGENKDLEELNEFADEKDLEIAILNPENLSKSEIKQLKLKEGNIYVYKKGKNTYKYNKKIEKSALITEFRKEGLIERTYMTIGINEYLDIIKKDGYHFMFIGSESCGYCKQFKESVNESLKKYDYNVYYLDISSLSQEDYDKLYQTDSYFSENEWGTPLNFLYKYGKRIGEISGYVPASELISFLKDKKVV